MNNIRFIGLDVHKHSISVASPMAALGIGGISRRDRQRSSCDRQAVRTVAAAGQNFVILLRGRPCGYGILRQIKALGIDAMCGAIADPPQASDRVKTDRRDATISPGCTAPEN